MAANNEDVKGWSGIASIHRTAERNCLKTPDKLRTKVLRAVKTGHRSPVCAVGYQQNVRLRLHSATFQTVSEGRFSESRIQDGESLSKRTGAKGRFVP